MKDVEQLIRDKSIERLTKIFNVEASLLSDDIDLTTQFDPKPVSFFKRNEFDKVADDLQDAASNNILSKLNAREIEVKTVGDYINFMIMCYKDRPNMVESIFGEI
jgi:hypothetical protein